MCIGRPRPNYAVTFQAGRLGRHDAFVPQTFSAAGRACVRQLSTRHAHLRQDEVFGKHNSLPAALKPPRLSRPYHRTQRSPPATNSHDLLHVLSRITRSSFAGTQRSGTAPSRASVRGERNRDSTSRRVASSLSPRGLSSPSGSFASAVRGRSSRVLLKSGDSRAKKPSFRRHSPLLAARVYPNSPLDTPISARMVFSGTTPK